MLSKEKTIEAQPSGRGTRRGRGLGVEVRPVGREVDARAGADPPVPNHALRPWLLVMHWPLAAKANSPGRAGGIPAGSTTLHVMPPSVVLMIRNFRPSGGSES